MVAFVLHFNQDLSSFNTHPLAYWLQLLAYLSQNRLKAVTNGKPLIPAWCGMKG